MVCVLSTFDESINGLGIGWQIYNIIIILPKEASRQHVVDWNRGEKSRLEPVADKSLRADQGNEQIDPVTKAADPGVRGGVREHEEVEVAVAGLE